MELTNAERDYLAFIIRGDLETLDALVAQDGQYDDAVDREVAVRLLRKLTGQGNKQKT